MPPPRLLEEHRAHGGVVRVYAHDAAATRCAMRFSVFLPPVALRGERDAPVLYVLAGLTCTHDTFFHKAGAAVHAARLGIALVAPDTSPRDVALPPPPDPATTWDFGLGASFYLDASHPDYAAHFNMHEYLVRELPQVLVHDAQLPVDTDRAGILGHSMGGLGALVAALRHPGRYKSVSAFAPIAHPSACPWGQKALRHYLRDPASESAHWDPALLLERYTGNLPELTILVDQGTDDEFYHAGQLLPERLLDAAKAKGVVAELTLRYQQGYDHGYWFIQTFIAEHMEHHARFLCIDAQEASSLAAS